MTFEEMKYGPLGEMVERAMPTSEADPVGVYAAAISVFSSAISGSVTMYNGRPVVVWTVLAGGFRLWQEGQRTQDSAGGSSRLLGMVPGAPCAFQRHIRPESREPSLPPGDGLPDNRVGT